ncbi:interleukin-20 [Phodopus roborovskii]|uniref:Interleukin family protein n=1 Tax=Phodopus roborovskii TaxID=109678 RepID=A0AAV0A2L8_PHORO|nr:interleukin-20 [Phodopus roborovskii]CAH7197932.1 Il20 [Phodopus roborovskii]
MKGFGFAFGLFSVVGFLLWTPLTGLETLHLGRCVIAVNLQAIQKEFSEIRDSVQAEDENTDIRILRTTESLQDVKPPDRCCFLRHLVRFYLDRVFKFYRTPDYHILRKTSSLANSFLIIKKDLSVCHSRMACHCGEEAMEKYNHVLNHFTELELRAAVVKALGEVGILLRWMEEMI